MAVKYYEPASAVQVIGGIYKKPELLDEQDKYNLVADDFQTPLHKLLFGTMFNLKAQGISEFDSFAIVSYLSDKPSLMKIFEENRGMDYLNELESKCNADNFDYYYNRVKKFTLMRSLYNIGFDMTTIYDPLELFDDKKIKAQNKWLDETSIEDITAIVDERIEEIKQEYLGNVYSEGQQLGSGALELIERFKQEPEYGIPLVGDLVNTVFRGARLKKAYLRSAASGFGKSRTMLGDACNFSVKEKYENGKWVENEFSEPTLFISTELEIEECQTMALAFISGVNESHILDGEYYAGEEERVIKAAHILAEAPLYIEFLPDFSIRDVESSIKKHIRKFGCKYVAQ